jgi:hypothetical protein
LPTQRDSSLRLSPSRNGQENPERLSFSGAEKEGVFLAISPEGASLPVRVRAKLRILNERAAGVENGGRSKIIAQGIEGRVSTVTARWFKGLRFSSSVSPAWPISGQAYPSSLAVAIR